ncbi:MAG: hypothetical protein WC728_03235 [Elusimicrobiota bacterium]
MKDNLEPQDLVRLIKTSMAPRPGEKRLAILVDLPDAKTPDTPEWRELREICFEWRSMLGSSLKELGLDEVRLYAYGNVGSNNADLPSELFAIEEDPAPLSSADLASKGRKAALEQALRECPIVLAPTHFSTTAPLKLLAKSIPFRAATMPGFTRAFLPSLGLDYGKVHERVAALAGRLGKAVSAEVVLSAGKQRHRLVLDLRFREGHASGGLIREAGQVGNLPSGEAYIAPYEGEREGLPSRSSGTLPVQFDDEIVVYEVRENRARRVVSKGPRSEGEAERLRREPAYGNMAELGLGILDEFGIKPVGATLLDEKLGLHIAFGRSDHFGGATSPASFSSPSAVVHIDYVYVPSLQPDVSVDEVSLSYEDGRETLMRDGRYLELLPDR